MKLSRVWGLVFGLLCGIAIATQINILEMLHETSFWAAMLFGFLGGFLGLLAGCVCPVPFLSNRE